MKWLDSVGRGFRSMASGYAQLFVRHPVLTSISTFVLLIVLVAVTAVAIDSIIHAVKS